MNRLFTLMITLIPTVSAFAAQTITCNLSESESRDQVVISLTNDQGGKFLYKTVETGTQGNSADQGTLPLKRGISNDKAIAKFEVQSQVMTMSFEMPTSVLSTNSPGFKAKLLTQISTMDLEEEQALQCSSKL